MRSCFVSVIVALILMPASLHAGLRNGILRAPVHLSTSQSEPGVRLALEDLARDVQKTLGGKCPILSGKNGDIVVRIDRSLGQPESWKIQITKRRVLITGADELGAVYGIYDFSRRFLGIDPLWYWEDQQIPSLKSVRLEPQTLRSKPAAFRYRGWFINDEDLLSGWKTGGGRRYIGDYPYYSHVMPVDLADHIFEALLRSGGNLIIPGSFINVMNPPEAALVRRAVERGLYVTQHHIEPLGVSYYGFANYWKKRGQTVTFSYGTDPAKVRETWRAVAEKWHEICGNQVIWQLGLRGSGDRPVWDSDKSIKESDASTFINRAIADEWKIVRSVDPRPHPPATVTLWSEGSELMQKNALAIPPGITVVFSDKGSTQMLQRDFHQIKRARDHTYGVYYHLAYWVQGPHLIQGTLPERLTQTFDAVLAKGDTHYAIVNVSNVRPFVLGIAAVMKIMQQGAAWKRAEFFPASTPPSLLQPYREFFASFVELPNDQLLQDGTSWSMINRRLTELETTKKRAPTQSGCADMAKRKLLAVKLDLAIAGLNRVVREYPPADRIPVEKRGFYDYNLRNQASMLSHYYGCLRDLLMTYDGHNRLQAAGDEIEKLLEIRQAGATGRWNNWYRNDKKENIPTLLQRIRKDEAAENEIK